MTKYFIVILLNCFVIIVYGLPTNNTSDKLLLKPYELDEVISGSKFAYRTFNGKWISNNEFVYRKSNDPNLYLYNADTSIDSIIYDGDGLSGLTNINYYELSSDRKKILIRYDVISLYRYSSHSKFKIYDLDDTSSLKSVANDQPIQKCIWSPDGTSLAYVKENNVFYKQLDGTEKAITTDGVPHLVFNGIPDWVYEEEVLHNDIALWFSPTGDKLAWIQIDDRNVGTFTYHFYGTAGDSQSQYPKRVDIQYPKPGTTIPSVKVFVKSLADIENNLVVEFTAPNQNYLTENIIGPVRWYNNDNIVLTWFNRRQNQSYTEICDVNTKLCSQLFTISESKGWIDWWMIPVCFESGLKCFYFKHNNGWFGIQQVNVPSGISQSAMDREVTAIEIFGHDSNSEYLYYSSTLKDHPEYKHVYRNNECLTCDITGPDGDICNYANAVFSQDYSYFIMICNGPALPYSKIFSTETIEEIRYWEENQSVRDELKGYEPIQIVYDRIPVDGGFHAISKLFIPNEINIEETLDKYPMIVYIYGAPNHVRVLDSFGVGFQNYLVTNLKVIYCQIDGRGSGYKGTEMLFTINNHRGTVEIEDNIAVTKYLTNKYKFIDADRIGIWGWSYGGFATAYTVSMDSENIFKGGISVAPTSAILNYNAIYSERYMGAPTEEDNLAGYTSADVTRRADKFHNHNFFLIHGNADDNVHFQHAMLFSKTLQKENVYFEQLSYPDEDHSLSGVLPHLYKTMDNFWKRILNINDVGKKIKQKKMNT